MEESRLFELLRESVSPYHTVLAAKKRLEEAGFQQLFLKDSWALQPKGKYYVIHRDSAMFAFTIGVDQEREVPVRIAAAHTDFPGLSIKADPEMHRHGYVQLNVEVYGGAILNTWLDRPLSAAGKVALRSANPMRPDIRFVDLKEPFCTIPNLAIHMNREINKGVELNRQVDMLPIAGLEKNLKDENRFVNYLAEYLGVNASEILDFDLYLYSTQPPVYTGMEQEMIAAPHLDNTTSVQALLDGIIQTEPVHGINLAAMFDHEEIGSRTPQGAGSIQMRKLLEKVLKSLPQPESEDVLYDSMMLSVDVAHGIHPNHPEKADPVLMPKLGRGFCIKEACAQSYATDCRAVAVVQQICDQEKIPYQKYANRSNIPGGGTLGVIASAFLPIPIVDIGIPLLAMHSSCELMGTADMKALSDCVCAFFRIG